MYCTYRDRMYLVHVSTVLVQVPGYYVFFLMEGASRMYNSSNYKYTFLILYSTVYTISKYNNQ